MTAVKKRKRKSITKSFSKIRYVLISLAVLMLLMLLYTFSVEEQPMEVKSQKDMLFAKQTLEQQTQALDQRVGELRAFIT